jgi:hypothetical protein
VIRYTYFSQLHHWDLGIVMSSNSTSTVTTSYKRPSSNVTNLVPYLRLRGITAVPSFIFHDLAIVLWPAAWKNRITLEIRISNITHYTFSAGPASSQSQMQEIGFAPGLGLTWGFTGRFSFSLDLFSRNREGEFTHTVTFRCSSRRLCNNKWGGGGGVS